MTSSHTNLPASNFGCATHRNLGLMVANPRDLLRGQEMGPTSGARAAKGVERYYRGDRWIPTGSEGSSGAGGGSGGSGGSGGKE
jgi:pilus assembly protein CpaD